MRLLLVDDEVLSIEGLRDGINWEKCGIREVLCATSSKAAKELLQTEEIDILLFDIEMPEETGIQLLEWCRSQKYDMPCTFLTCHAQFQYAQEALRLGCLDYVLKPVDYGVIEDVILRMVDIVLAQKKKSRMEYYGEQWFQERVKSAQEKTAAPVDSGEVVEDTIQYISQHLSEKLSLEELACRVHLNADYLNRIFKKQQGISINKYIINERMQLAKELLQEGRLSANAVALEVGYDNYANFVNMFKKVHGHLPSQV